MGYVPQECVLFTGTIKDNIAQGMDGATDEDVLRAARLAGVHQYIVDLPAATVPRLARPDRVFRPASVNASH